VIYVRDESKMLEKEIKETHAPKNSVETQVFHDNLVTLGPHDDDDVRYQRQEHVSPA
jgi:hypothetical protein